MTRKTLLARIARGLLSDVRRLRNHLVMKKLRGIIHVGANTG